MSYHQRTVNIPIGEAFTRRYPTGGVSLQAYKAGHRDARHAAAEIANEADAEVERLTEERDKARAGVAVLHHEVERLTRERDGLAKALTTAKDAVWAAHDFLLRDYREDNPEKGIVVDESALPTWNLLCDAIDALAALPKEDDRGLQ